MSFALYFTYVVLDYLRPVETFAPELQVYRPMVFLAIAALILSVVSAAARGYSTVSIRYFVICGALLVWVGVSVLATGWTGGAIPAMISFGTSAVMFVLTTLNVTSRERFLVIIRAVVVCTVILAAFSVYSYHFGFMNDRLVIREGDLLRIRSLGFLNDPNDFGQAIVIALPLLVCFLKRGRLIRSGLLVAPSAALLLYAIYLTHSRGAVLGVLAALTYGGRRAVGRFGTGLLLIAVIAGAAMTNLSGGREYSTEEESAGGRIDAWSDGLSMLASRPVTGVGFGQFTSYSYYTAHNSFVLCFAELGLVGYSLWLGWIVLVFLQLGATLSGRSSDVWRVALKSSLVGFVACAWFLSRTYIDTLFLFLGLGAVCPFAETGNKPDPQSAGRWAMWTAGSLVVTVSVVYAMVRMRHL